jgi:hypothetical protein
LVLGHRTYDLDPDRPPPHTVALVFVVGQDEGPHVVAVFELEGRDDPRVDEHGLPLDSGTEGAAY